MTYIVQHQRTSLDTNGNPRRLWVIYRDRDELPSTRYVGFYRIIDEGYGVSSAARAMKEAGLDGEPHLILPDIDITPGQYREGLRVAERIDPTNGWRVRWVDDGTIYCYAANRTRARRFAAEYNHPFRNDERPIRVVAEPNV